jgi:serine/threonine protein kinase
LSKNFLGALDVLEEEDSFEINQMMEEDSPKAFFKQNSKEKTKLCDFELLRVLGKGGFSTVYEAKRKSDGKIFALKCMKKDKIRREGKMHHVMNERKVLETVGTKNCKLLNEPACPFILQMHSAFQTVSCFCSHSEL